jgi:hypothetical protein
MAIVSLMLSLFEKVFIYHSSWSFHVLRRIHESLMAEQQNQLDDLRKWLTLTEDRISRLSEQFGPDLNALHAQIDSLRSLQSDLQDQQKNVDLLSNLVVIVEDGSNENGIPVNSNYCADLPSTLKP